MINDDLHVVHARAAGLDVHKMSITATVRICDEGQGSPTCETREFSALPTGLAKLSRWLLDHRVTAAGMEATGIFWEAPRDVLADAGIEVQLYNAQQVKQLRGRKTDVQDSLWLARICQFDLARRSLVLDAKFRQLRVVSRARSKLVKDRSRLRNRAHKVLDRCGARVGGILSDVFGVNGRVILEGLAAGEPSEMIIGRLTGHVASKRELLIDALSQELSDADRIVLRSVLDLHRAHERELRELDRHIAESLGEHQHLLNLMQTIPGIGFESACAILIEMGPDCSVFHSCHEFASWAGLCPGNNASGGKRRNARTARGNPHLRTVLVECAQAAARTKQCQYHGYHTALKIRRGFNRATVATAHKLARTLYSVLRNQRPYSDPAVDYDQLMVARNAPRWIRKLKEYGYLEDPSRKAA